MRNDGKIVMLLEMPFLFTYLELSFFYIAGLRGTGRI